MAFLNQFDGGVGEVYTTGKERKRRTKRLENAGESHFGIHE
jgi:hypothetical protein